MFQGNDQHYYTEHSLANGSFQKSIDSLDKQYNHTHIVYMFKASPLNFYVHN